MNKIILFLLLFTTSINFAQTKISFDYDAAGNQTIRQICISCKKTISNEVIEIGKLTAEDLQKFSPEDVISYYPNPVKEQLYLKWELINENKLSTIQIYSLTGQLLKTINKLEATTNVVIDFNSFPNGIYNLLLNYTNGENKSIKIIK